MWPVFRGESMDFVSRLWVKSGVRDNSFNWSHKIFDIRGFSDSVISHRRSLDDINNRKSGPSWFKQNMRQKRDYSARKLLYDAGFFFLRFGNVNTFLHDKFLLNKLFFCTLSFDVVFLFFWLVQISLCHTVDNARFKRHILHWFAESNSLLLDLEFITWPRFKFSGRVAESTLHETTNIPTAWLVQLVERLTAVLVVEGSSSRPD